MRVKICGITRLEDLRAAVAAGADALGFVFAPRSPRLLDPAAATDLVRSVPAFISRVGLFMDQDAGDIRRILDQVPLSLLQFHGGEDAAFCRGFGLPYIKALAMGSSPSLMRAQTEFPDAAALLMDSHRSGETGGTGKTFDWRTIASSLASLERPVILAGGLTPANVRQAVCEVRPWAVDVSSGVEDAPGMKNVAKMQIFIREAKSEY